jgi:hypothetical protein
LVVFDVWNLWSVAQSETSFARYSLGILSALADLSISSAHLASALSKPSGRLAPLIAKGQEDATRLTALANKVNASDDRAKQIVVNKLKAAGWFAGMFTTALMLSDAAVSFANGQRGVGFSQVIKAGGVATMTNAELIAARIVTPMGGRAIQRSSVQAAQAALARLIPAAARWTGTVASGWITAIGFGIYIAGEAVYYRLMDDAVSQWLRAGPFSGDRDEQTAELESEAAAHIELVKAMTPVSFQRLPDKKKLEWLKARKLEVWKEEAESILTFASPAFAITGEPTEVEMELSWQQEHYRILPPNPAGGRSTETIAKKSGRLIRGIQEDYDEQRHAIDLMVGRAQLSDLTPRSESERVDTHYKVKRLTLTFTVQVWRRETGEYEPEKVTHVMEDLDVEWQR